MMIGLVGLGRMGAAMARRLRDRGHDLLAWDRDGRAMDRHVGRGFRIAANARAVAASADTIISTITEDEGVRGVFLGPNGFLAGDVAGKLFIEMSTLRPATHRELAPLVKAGGAGLVDAPVMGSIPTARGTRIGLLATT